MITIKQIKAARSLLDWTQNDLAKVSGFSMAAIAKIEQGQGNPRVDTMAAIQGAFERYGITFLGTHGVDKTDERFDLKNYLGPKAVYEIWRDIRETLPNGGEILLGNLDDKYWDEYYRQDLIGEIARRDALGIHFRALLCEGDDFIIINRPHQYRTVPKAVFAQIPYYVYKNKVVFMMITTEPHRYVLIEHAPLAESFRSQFEYYWRTGNKPVLAEDGNTKK